MFSPLGAVAEYEILSPEDPLLPVPLQVAEHLEPVDYRILTLLFQGKTMEAVAGEVERSRSEIVARVGRPRFEHLKKEVEKGIVEQIARGGEFEPITMARANASPAMRRIIALSKRSRAPLGPPMPPGTPGHIFFREVGQKSRREGPKRLRFPEVSGR